MPSPRPFAIERISHVTDDASRRVLVDLGVSWNRELDRPAAVHAVRAALAYELQLGGVGCGKLAQDLSNSARFAP
jgi:hypothetical protein